MEIALGDEQAPFSQTAVATAETVQFYSLVYNKLSDSILQRG